MKIFAVVVSVLLYTSTGFTQAPEQTVNTEVQAAIMHLTTIPEYDRNFIRYFTTYNIEKEKRDKVVLSLSFVLHSLVGISDDPNEGNAGAYYPLAIAKDFPGLDVNLQIDPEEKPLVITSKRLVAGSETLWWIDLREFNFTPQAWENVSVRDPYFSMPAVDRQKDAILRILSGNAILRADWFIFHATDMSIQTDKKESSQIYNELIFAKSTIPKKTEEWRQYWGLDKSRSRRLGNEFGALIINSKNVSRTGNRLLFYYRTELGYMYETYDTVTVEGERDYAENLVRQRGLPPTVSDAGELFTTNMLGMQVYALRNEKDELVSFADASAARHLHDVIRDTRVIVARSCMDCHASGPIPPENAIREFIEENGKIYTPRESDKLRIERAFLSKKFEDSIKVNQEYFAQSMKKVNGLTPEENGKIFLEIIQDYNRPVTLKVAANECGVTTEEFVQKNIKSKSLRILALIRDNKPIPIPRSSWDSTGKDGQPGHYQRAVVNINGLTANVLEKQELIPVKNTITIVKDTKIKVTENGVERVVAEVKVGDKVETNGTTDGVWIGVLINGQKAWIQSKYVDRR